MLVASAAALLVSLSQALVMHFSVEGDLIRSDRIRIIEAVITGVSFLGAGTIIRHRTLNASSIVPGFYIPIHGQPALAYAIVSIANGPVTRISPANQVQQSSS